MFEKDLDGEWNREAIGFAHDLIFLVESKEYADPGYAKLLKFLDENRDCRELMLKYAKSKYDSWLKAVDELRELQREYHGLVKTYRKQNG